MIATQKSLDLIRYISDKMKVTTYHHHTHILYDLPLKENGVYVEIGCYAGATACLMLQKENIKVISIDTGELISQDIVKNNIKKFNIYGNFFNYIEGNSHSETTIYELKKITNSIDILFIDGDHKKESVMNDFLLYHEMVVPGGYIVFDDYNDYQRNPEVRPTVDMIVRNFPEYEVIGTGENILDARPPVWWRFRPKSKTTTEYNCFILKKLNRLIASDFDISE